MAIRVRPATAADAPRIVAQVRALAAYEREPAAAVLTQTQLVEALATGACCCLVAERDQVQIGFAVYGFTWSTWTGTRTLALEDLFVTAAARGTGVGRALMRALAAEALALGCARVEWSVLDWNGPAIGFYDRLGAHPLSAWQRWRVDGPALARLAAAEEDGMGESAS